MNETETVNPMECECSGWARANPTTAGMLGHHESCPNRNKYDGVREFAKRIVRAFECWASDEDGVHPEAWQAYQEARMVAGLPLASEKVS